METGSNCELSPSTGRECSYNNKPMSLSCTSWFPDHFVKVSLLVVSYLGETEASGCKRKLFQV